MRRKVLFITVIVFFGIGISFAALPFIFSLRPSERAMNALTQLDVSELPTSSYKFHTLPTEGVFGISFLIVKGIDGRVKVFELPTFKGMLMMPDREWFRYGGSCTSFGPEMLDGKIKLDGIIKCNDSGLTDWQNQEWAWRNDGENMGKWSPDLEQPKYRISAGNLILGRQ